MMESALTIQINLPKYEKQWNSYLIMMSKLLQEQCESNLRAAPHHQTKSDNEDNDIASSSSSEDIFNVLNALDCLGYYGLRQPWKSKIGRKG